jgi:hypothetical protein
MRHIASVVNRTLNIAVRALVCSWNGHTRSSAIEGFCRACNKRLPDAKHALIRPES